MTTFDLTRNAKQRAFFMAVFAAVGRYEKYQAEKAAYQKWYDGGCVGKKPKVHKDREPFRIFSYGGAVQGGKTYLCLAILTILCKKYPGSRWHVIRASLPDLERTAEQSMKELLQGCATVRWRRGRSDYYLQFKNGSRIYFMAESFTKDKDLNRFKGLQTNGFLLEQVEELQLATFEKAIERAGRHRCKKMPPNFIFMTFNPAWTWIKEKVYDPWVKKELKCPHFFVEALPGDNPFVDEQQWDLWNNLDSKTYARFIRGVWDLDIDGRFAHAFQMAVHGKHELEYSDEWPLYYAFDFNVDPSCAIVFQTDGRSFFHVLREYRIRNGDTWKLAEAIRDDWKHLMPHDFVCGDASGRQRMSGTRGAVSQYHIIQSVLNVPWDRFLVPKANPEIPDSRVLTNSVIEKLTDDTGEPGFQVDPSCEWTIHDLMFCVIKLNEQGRVGIQKTGKLKHAKQGAQSMGHLLDTVRYGVHVTLPKFARAPKS